MIPIQRLAVMPLLFAPLTLLAPALLAAEAPDDYQRPWNKPVECRPVVLVGGNLQGSLVCKTRKEWLEYDCLVRGAIV